MHVKYCRVSGIRPYHAMIVQSPHDDFEGASALAATWQTDLARLVQEQHTTVDAVVLRGHPPRRDATTLPDAGYHLCRAALDAWSPLLTRELLAVIRIELAPSQLSALRAGTGRLLQELEMRCHRGDAVAWAESRSARRWFDEALGFWSVDFEAAMGEWLPRHLDAVERRRFNRSRAVTEPLPLPGF